MIAVVVGYELSTFHHDIFRCKAFPTPFTFQCICLSLNKVGMSDVDMSNAKVE